MADRAIPGRGWDYHPDALAEMAGPIPETFSEMMIEERGPMPDEFGRMTPVPSSDEEAVKQQFRAVLADGTVGDLRQYIEMNIGDLKLLAQTDNSIAKDLEAALRFISTGDQSRFQGVSPDQTLQTWDEAFQADQNIAQKTFEPPPLMEGSFQAMDEDRYDPLTYLEMFDRAPYGEATPDMLPREARQHYQTAPGYDTLLEPYPRARGYDLGGLVTPAGPGTFPQTASETMMAQNTSGGVPPGEARLLEQFNIIFESGSDFQKRSFVMRNADALMNAADKDFSVFNKIQAILNNQNGMPPLPSKGELLAPPYHGEYSIYENPKIPWTRESKDAWAGMGSSFPGPSFVPREGKQTAPDFEALEEVRGTVPGMQGYAHGGYVRGRGRGTMPGELHPKGSLSVRVAGESMGEYRKHREDEDEHRPVRRTLDNALSPTLSRRMFS